MGKGTSVARSLLMLVLAFAIRPCGASTFDQDFPKKISTEHFVFYCQGPGTENVEQIAAFSEGFLAVIKSRFFEPAYDYPIHVLALPTPEAFGRYLHERHGITQPPRFGIFFSELRTFITFESSGLGTFAHEILHPLVERNLPHCPAWATEGIPAFFEKFFGYWENGRLVLNFGYQNPWRIHQLGDGIDRIDLGEILHRRENNYALTQNSDCRLVSLFLWRQGKLKDYLDLVRLGDRRGRDTYLEATLGVSLKEIEPAWRKYLQDTRHIRPFIYTIPPSAVFPNRADFDSFVRQNLLNLIF